MRLFDALLNFLFSTKEKSAIINNKHGIYDLPHELPNGLRLLGKLGEISGKSQNSTEWYPSARSSGQNENCVKTSEKLLKNRN